MPTGITTLDWSKWPDSLAIVPMASARDARRDGPERGEHGAVGRRRSLVTIETAAPHTCKQKSRAVSGLTWAASLLQEVYAPAVDSLKVQTCRARVARGRTACCRDGYCRNIPSRHRGCDGA